MVDRVVRPVVPLTHANEVEHRRMLAQRASACVPKDGTEAMTAPLPMMEYTTAGLPTASLQEGGITYDGTLNLPTYSDGSAWVPLATKASVDALTTTLNYAAGTFSPTYLTSGVAFTSVTYDANRWGRYTRIGREVHFRLRLSTDAITIGAASGNLLIGGLPFTSADLAGVVAGFQAVAVSYRGNFAATPPMTALVNEAAAYMELFHLTSTTAASTNCPAATTVSTGADQNLIYIGGSYQVSD